MSEVFTTTFAGRNVSIKTNYLAGQADGAALVTYGDTLVLVTAVSLQSKRRGSIFCPSRWIIRKRLLRPGRSPADFSSGKGV